MYIHETKDWPLFTWHQAQLADLLAEVRYRQGRLLGRMEGLGIQLCGEATLTTLTQDVVNTSAIDGENLDPKQVRACIAKRLGMDSGTAPAIDRNVEGPVAVVLDATRNHAVPLSEERMFAWQAALFPTGRSGRQPITVGRWRPASSAAMPVAAGPLTSERVDYEAPSADRLSQEMAEFIKWFNADPTTDLVVKAAVAHFWFVAIHPFEDGNGRIARALTDLTLARAEQSAQRFYSLSSQIRQERNAYSAAFDGCQTGSLDITPWITWSLDCLKRALAASEATLEAVLSKARFWEAHVGQSFNNRQLIIINRLLDGVAGQLTSSKWAKLTQCSQDTALRDINDLLKSRLLVKEDAGGRSTSYRLRLPE